MSGGSDWSLLRIQHLAFEFAVVVESDIGYLLKIQEMLNPDFINPTRSNSSGDSFT